MTLACEYIDTCMLCHFACSSSTPRQHVYKRLDMYQETNMRDAIRNGMKNEGLKNLIVGSMQKKLKDGLIAQNQGNDSRESMTQIGG